MLIFSGQVKNWSSYLFSPEFLYFHRLPAYTISCIFIVIIMIVITVITIIILCSIVAGLQLANCGFFLATVKETRSFMIVCMLVKIFSKNKMIFKVSYLWHHWTQTTSMVGFTREIHFPFLINLNCI